MRSVFLVVSLLLLMATNAVAQKGNEHQFAVALGDLPGVSTGNVTAYWLSQKELQTHTTLTTSLPGCKIDGYKFLYAHANKSIRGPFTVNGAALSEQLKTLFDENKDGRMIVDNISLTCKGERRTVPDSIILRHPDRYSIMKNAGTAIPAFLFLLYRY